MAGFTLSVVRFFKKNGFLFTVLEFRRRLIIMLRSKIYARYFKISGMIVEDHPHFVGAKYIIIGRSFACGKNFWLEAIDDYRNTKYTPRINIGNNVTIMHSVHIASATQVTIGDNVLIGSRVLITDHNHGVYNGDLQSSPDTPPSDRLLETGRAVEIGRNVWIGEGVVILPGSVIGSGCVVAANSVVSGNVPEDTVVAGIPARVMRRFNRTDQRWEKIDR